ncbi:uncharacterized protein (TIGR04255 family) [Rhizobium aethiopicum]|uniref:TIGR04255 family protein n=1 Tax=Rhizobium aethiopicum TaxID=1138170 RepID=UPI00161BD18F|nr:TIGR04255 family protein [Rhizobium aethiopicum]MBB4583069.1 uncharacterized protein (TIGR04255 family) [Rhizobium aethiopicum]
MPEMTRPEGLPDFRQPPLNEVVLGVQFPPSEGYQQIYAGDVWKLFKANYPLVVEHPPLAPIYETFGPPGGQNFELSIGPAGQHNRYWFLSADHNELIQFQNDRLLHNWRQLPNSQQEYPRFESLIAKFQKEFIQLSDFLKTLQPAERQRQLVCNQVEVTYINHILLPKESRTDPSAVLRVANFGAGIPDDAAFIWRRALLRSDGKPYARLICEANSALNYKGENIVVLTITVRGNPSVGTIGNIVDFMKNARETIVKEFANITTDSAHAAWERIL